MACLLAGIAIRNHRAPAPAPSAIVRSQATGPPARAATIETAKPFRANPRITRRAKLPKEAQFPIRTPLTREERALMAFVRNAPEDAQQAFGETLPAEIEPLRIEEIQLQPLQTGDGAR
jgi:hypothetical protein